MMSTTAVRRKIRNSRATPSLRLWSRDWMLATLALFSWTFAPFLRRVFEYETGGFHALDVLSLLPLISILPLALYAFKREALQRIPNTLKILLWIWTASLVYGVLVAALAGNVGGSVYEFAQYELPAIFGIWFAGQALAPEAAMNRLVGILLPLCIVIGIYGILQWISPPSWDVEWVEQSGLQNMGPPLPFSLRIFSTLNSTGPAADFFALAILFAFPTLRLRSVTAFVGMALLSAALLLTLVRSAWIGATIGLIVYFVASPNRLRLLPVLAGGAILIVVLAGSLPTLLGNGYNSSAIVDRVQTFNDVEHDSSAEDRQGEYVEALSTASATPFGLGLGAFGPAARLSGSVDVGQMGKVLDGGYLARLLSLGWFGFLAYIVVVAGAPVWLLYVALSNAKTLRTSGGALVALGGAVGMYLVWDDFAGDSHLGLAGLMFWIATAIAFRVVGDNGKVTS